MTVKSALNNKIDTIEVRSKFNDSKVKGIALINSIKFIKTTLGKDAFERILSHLEIPQQISFRKKIQENDYYGLAEFIDINSILAHTHYNGDKSKLREAGLFAGKNLFGIKDQIQLKFQSPLEVAKTLSRRLETIYIPTKLNVTSIGNKHIQIELNNFFDPTETLIYRYLGIFQYAFETKGFSNVLVSFEITRDNEDHYTIQIIWS